jgi:hypothetical protein
MKISVPAVCRNCAATIGHTLDSFFAHFTAVPCSARSARRLLKQILSMIIFLAQCSTDVGQRPRFARENVSVQQSRQQTRRRDYAAALLALFENVRGVTQ